MTHYLPFFAVARSVFRGRVARQLQAICGEFIDAKDHSIEPECAACAQWLQRTAEDEAETARALENEFSEFKGRLTT